MLTLQAKKGDIAVEDMDGGTFTISNGGVFGSLLGTPIINPPQSAILGMHGIFDRPVAVKGEVVGFVNYCWLTAAYVNIIYWLPWANRKQTVIKWQLLGNTSYQFPTDAQLSDYFIC